MTHSTDMNRCPDSDCNKGKIPCTCLIGGMDLDGHVCGKCNGMEWRDCPNDCHKSPTSNTDGEKCPECGHVSRYGHENYHSFDCSKNPDFNVLQPTPTIEGKKCCDGECNHDDCCGKIPENCIHKFVRASPLEVEEIVESVTKQIAATLKEFVSNVISGLAPNDTWYVEAHRRTQDAIRAALTQLATQERKAFGGCTKCYGKGYSTEQRGRIGSSRHTVRDSEIIYNPCSCDRGKQIEKLMEHLSA